MLTTIAHFKEKVIITLTTGWTEHNDKAAATDDVKPRNTFNQKLIFLMN